MRLHRTLTQTPRTTEEDLVLSVSGETEEMAIWHGFWRQGQVSKAEEPGGWERGLGSTARIRNS